MANFKLNISENKYFSQFAEEEIQNHLKKIIPYEKALKAIEQQKTKLEDLSNSSDELEDLEQTEDTLKNFFSKEENSSWLKLEANLETEWKKLNATAAERQDNLSASLSDDNSNKGIIAETAITEFMECLDLPYVNQCSMRNRRFDILTLDYNGRIKQTCNNNFSYT